MRMPVHVAALCERRLKSATVTDRRYQQGTAVVIVLVLAFVMGMLISDNGLVLHQLKQEMQLIEQKQLKHHEARLRRLKKLTTENTEHTEPGLVTVHREKQP